MNCLLLLLFFLSTIILSCSSEQNKKENKVKYRQGKMLFNRYCDECHNKNMIHDMTAPALGEVLEKRDSTWLRYYIRTGAYAQTEGDTVLQKLRAEGWAGMPSFDYLADEEIENILLFVEIEFEKNKGDLEKEN